MAVDQISQSAGQRWEQEHAGQTSTRPRLSSGIRTSVGTAIQQIYLVIQLPHSVAVTLVCLQLIQDQMQELTFLLWKISVGIHGNASVDRKMLLLWRLEIKLKKKKKLPVVVTNTKTNSHSAAVEISPYFTMTIYNY